MKTLIILALSLALIGCSNTIATERNLTSPYVVKSIESWYKSSIFCVYDLNTNDTYTATKNNLVVRDSIGKFSINDTIFITLIKK